ncbi:MAG: DegT/DnrJ/EryC1/StrS family aminotransferase [Cytophagales bacterium]|nr:DegT/DnrJ/EryC1/StrS family aminotransferase [Cytophagales bacterium]
MIEYENLNRTNQPFFEAFQADFADSLQKGYFILGNKLVAFENEFAQYTQSPFCCGVASGLDALILALKALDLPEGTEVLVPSNSYYATVISIIHAGLTPVLVEPDIRTYNLDPNLIEGHLTPKTKVVMLVHLYGKSCDMDPILSICKKHGLFLIEDCAQSHGATYKGQMTGTFGDFGSFSFYPTKNLGALGDAGAIITSHPANYEKVKTWRNYGTYEKYKYRYVGYNSRLDDIQAGFLSIKLKKLDDINAHKRKLASIYLQSLKSDFILPVVEEGYHDVYHIFNIRHEKRDQLREYLLKNDIKTEIHYPVPPHQQLSLEMDLKGHFPIAEKIHQTTLSLPIAYFHSENDIHKVCEVLNKF